MRRLTVMAFSIGLFCCADYLSAQGPVRQQGRAIVEYSDARVKAVAAYEYSRRNHDGAWLLVELAVMSKARIAIERSEISLLTPDERRIPVATQEEFLDDRPALTKLLQNAVTSRRPLQPYFTSTLEPTIRFYTSSAAIVHNSFVTNLDEVAAGDVLFRAPDGRWPAGTYRLVIDHEKANAVLPLTLE